MNRLDDKQLEALKPGSTKQPNIPPGMFLTRKDIAAQNDRMRAALREIVAAADADERESMRIHIMRETAEHALADEQSKDNG